MSTDTRFTNATGAPLAATPIFKQRARTVPHCYKGIVTSNK